MLRSILSVPSGYSMIQGGPFTPHGASTSVVMDTFGMKGTPVTNAEYGVVSRRLGQNRFVLLNHNFKSGQTHMVRCGSTENATTDIPKKIWLPVPFHQNYILILGSQILLKMLDNPSMCYDREGEMFSAANQPVVGVTYFHAKAWCLLKSLEEDGKYHYDLPTDIQYEYVASDKGSKEFGTETGTLMMDGRKLAHVEESKGPTVAVDDERYEQMLPFGVQTTGNVERWIQMNPEFKPEGINGPFATRGGAWGIDAAYAHATSRNSTAPDDRGFDVSFQPVIVPRDS